jgi:hypothetical protein
MAIKSIGDVPGVASRVNTTWYQPFVDPEADGGQLTLQVTGICTAAM